MVEVVVGAGVLPRPRARGRQLGEGAGRAAAGSLVGQSEPRHTGDHNQWFGSASIIRQIRILVPTFLHLDPDPGGGGGRGSTQKIYYKG